MQIEPLNPNKQELHVLLPYDDLGRDATHGQGCAVNHVGPVIQETGTLFHETKKYFHFIFLTGSSLFSNTLNQIRN